MRPFLLLSAILLCGLLAGGEEAGIHLAQGALAGEVTQTDVILQTRLTATAGLQDGDVPGAAGGGSFVIAENEKFENPRRSDWLKAVPEQDYILKTKVGGLKPGTRYYFRVEYGSDAQKVTPGPVCTFRTLPAADSAMPTRLIVTSCMNYAFFHNGVDGKGGYTGADKHLGYPALETIVKLEPDLWVGDGDNVYYDHPIATSAKTQAELRRKWHEQHVQPRFVSLFAKVATLWLKDDHDHRYNDSDPTGDNPPSHELGIKTFVEQVPVADPAIEKPLTYRTHRVGRDLQIWMTEGRDFRSPNKMADGPGKSMWGGVQLEWLKRTLRESDATFKVLIMPSPMVGPDEAKKLDNHVNPKGFRREANDFFAWLKESGIPADRFFIVTGDRHWKYHSIHPTGYEEFCTGALNTENSRLGRAPGDPAGTDPEKLIKQLYTDSPKSGGFLCIDVKPAGEGRAASLEFVLYNATGEAVHKAIKSAR